MGRCLITQRSEFYCKTASRLVLYQPAEKSAVRALLLFRTAILEIKNTIRRASSLGATSVDVSLIAFGKMDQSHSGSVTIQLGYEALLSCIEHFSCTVWTTPLANCDPDSDPDPGTDSDGTVQVADVYRRTSRWKFL